MFAPHPYFRKVLWAVAALTLLVTARAQEMIANQQPFGAAKLDIATFEKMETTRLANAEVAIHQIVQNGSAPTLSCE